MDTHPKASIFTFRLGPLLLLIIYLLSAAVSSSSSFQVSSSSYLQADKKVKLDLYYETLCPFSARFIINYLGKLFDNSELISIVDLKLIPYGNAKILPNGTIVCQHGPNECLLNTIEACAINSWPDLNEHFPFIYCVEALVSDRKYSQWEMCFEKLGLDSTSVTDCFSSGYGKELELRYAAETNSLQPPHRYVPWVVVDGQPLYEDYENFISYICNAYKGSSVPQACTDASFSSSNGISILLKGKNTSPPVCYKEETTKLAAVSKARAALALWMHQTKMTASV